MYGYAIVCMLAFHVIANQYRLLRVGQESYPSLSAPSPRPWSPSRLGDLWGGLSALYLRKNQLSRGIALTRYAKNVHLEPVLIAYQPQPKPCTLMLSSYTQNASPRPPLRGSQAVQIVSCTMHQ